MSVNSHYIEIGMDVIIRRRSDNGIAFKFRNNVKGLVSAMGTCRRLINADSNRQTQLSLRYLKKYQPPFPYNPPKISEHYRELYSEEPLEPQIIFRRNSILNQRTVNKLLSQYPDGWV